MSGVKPPVGVLLLQLGTPDSPATGDVRRYLREFLSDPRVIDLPAPMRAALLNLVILPFRPRRSAHAYQQIWTDQGSPLTINTASLTQKVGRILGDRYRVEFGMRYQSPSIESAVERLAAAGCEQFVVLPLFPQYASAAGGSAAESALRLLGSRWNVPDVTLMGAFYDDPGFLDAAAFQVKTVLDGFHADHVLFSYHGLPEKQVRKSESTPGRCLSGDSCCAAITSDNAYCYRAQCFATTRGLAARLDLDEQSHSTTFQSRLAGQKWIEPYTDRNLPDLHRAGVRRLAVVTPSFTADCLETLEEIGIRARRQWEELGGEAFLLVPCVNDTDLWANAVAGIVESAVRS